MKKFASILLLTLVLSAASYNAQSQVTVRGNLLGYAGLVPNLGFEFGLSKHFTFVVEGYYSPFWDEKSFKAEGWLVTPEFRYYFCEKFNKWHIGLHGNYAQFDKLQIGSDMNMRDGSAYGAGLALGHTWRFNHHWSFDVFAGGGVWFLDTDIYCKSNENYLLAKDEKETKWGLTRLGATLAYRF